MQLNEILEENSINTMSQKTKISEENLENLLTAKFDSIKKIKALGFISILEREYKADLSSLREEALAYYSGEEVDRGITVVKPAVEEKKGKSKITILIVLALLVYASWYFLTQFDKKHLSGLVPFVDEQTIENFVGHSDETKKNTINENSAAVSTEEVVEDAVEEVSTDTPNVNETTMDNRQVEKTQEETIQSETITSEVQVVEKKTISLLPFSRLWFGVVDMETSQRNHFSIQDPYTFDVTKKSWLIATSSAPFSLVDGTETKDFNDAKEHYFKIDKNGIIPLSKDEYIALGGWSQW